MWSSGACPPAQSSPAGGWKQAGQMGSLYALGDPRGVGDHRLSKRLFTPPTALSRPSSPHLHVALLPRPQPLHESIIPQDVCGLGLQLAQARAQVQAQQVAGRSKGGERRGGVGLGLQLAQARARVQVQQVASHEGRRGERGTAECGAGCAGTDRRVRKPTECA